MHVTCNVVRSVPQRDKGRFLEKTQKQPKGSIHLAAAFWGRAVVVWSLLSLACRCPGSGFGVGLLMMAAWVLQPPGLLVSSLINNHFTSQLIALCLLFSPL